MDCVKDYADVISPHWIAVVATGMYTHIRQICVIGLCCEEMNAPFDPTYASMIFTFSVLCLLAEYKLWPRSLKEPPVQLLFVYEMLVSALITNLSTRAIWIPLVDGINCLTQESSTWLLWLNSVLGLGRYSYVATWAWYMAKESTSTHVTLCMAILSFVWMLDATETLESLLDNWTKDLFERCSWSEKRITFRNPLVSNWYTYALFAGSTEDREERGCRIRPS